jgi:hypothetical protein|eukprot:COSAG01_NODE_12236_length_1776_cov_2.517333_2_plen_86_part_00
MYRRGMQRELWEREFEQPGSESGPHHVQQALSLVPTELLMFAQAFEALYIPQGKVSVVDWYRSGSIDRQQIELLATRVSYNNRCL